MRVPPEEDEPPLDDELLELEEELELEELDDELLDELDEELELELELLDEEEPPPPPGANTAIDCTSRADADFQDCVSVPSAIATWVELAAAEVDCTE